MAYVSLFTDNEVSRKYKPLVGVSRGKKTMDMEFPQKVEGGLNMEDCSLDTGG